MKATYDRTTDRNHRRYSLYETGLEDWVAILRLAHQWQFSEVKALVVRELEKMIIDHIPKIVIYHTHEIDRKYLLQSYAALCAREQPLTLAEGKELGLETVLLIMRARECARGKSDGGIRSPIISSIDPIEMRSLVCDIFEIAPPAESIVPPSAPPPPAKSNAAPPPPATNGINGTNGIKPPNGAGAAKPPNGTGAGNGTNGLGLHGAPKTAGDAALPPLGPPFVFPSDGANAASTTANGSRATTPAPERPSSPIVNGNGHQPFSALGARSPLGKTVIKAHVHPCEI